MKKKRKINYQKLFCFASFIFILICILWYGGRFIYFYQDSKKTITEESNTFARILKTQNHDQETFKQINQTYYFYGDVPNNYVTYSNIIWRIVKVNKDNSIVLVLDHIIGTIAYGDTKEDYENSTLLTWLNQNNTTNSGIVEGILNQKEKYLIKTSTCTDIIDDMENITCNTQYKDYYLGLLSIDDYINTGGIKSFINNERYSYLANKTKENEIWYINNEGKLDTSTGEDILGIKPTITLSPTLEIISGTGTSEDPYQFEKEHGNFGSYVQLGNDTWRIYEEKDNILKLILQDTITNFENKKTSSTQASDTTSDKLKYIYSKNNYYHNDTTYGSLAYYLNHTYLNQLSYKNIIIENKYPNGYYGSDTNYQYQNILESLIDTKVSIPSIQDIILNDTLDGYFTNTGISENSSLIYIRKNSGTVSSKNVTTEAYVVPCISIEKDNIKAGSGTLEDPYRTE